MNKKNQLNQVGANKNVYIIISSWKKIFFTRKNFRDQRIEHFRGN